MAHAQSFLNNVALAPMTTIGLGGEARLFVQVDSVDQVRSALETAARQGLRWHILGGGSNTIFSDGGFDGLVIKIGMRGISATDDGGHVIIRAAAGEAWDSLVRHCVEEGWSGMECLSGIPGLAGATPIQNVGAYGQEVCDSIIRVEALDVRTLNEVTFTNEECRFSYRQSRFKQEDRDRYVITSVTFRLRRNGRPAIRYAELKTYLNTAVDLASLADGREVLTAVRTAVLTLRGHKSMLIDPEDPNSRSVGSFFVNPVVSKEVLLHAGELWRSGGGSGEIPAFPSGPTAKIPAAWLVEHAGFPKGYRKGGVGISSNHALALINAGGTTGELLAFAETVRTAVRDRFGIILELEPVVVA